MRELELEKHELEFANGRPRRKREDTEVEDDG